MIVFVADRRKGVVGAAQFAIEIKRQRVPWTNANAHGGGIQMVIHLIHVVLGGIGKGRYRKPFDGSDEPIGVVISGIESDPFFDAIIDVSKITHRADTQMAEIDRSTGIESSQELGVTGVAVDAVTRYRRVIDHSQLICWKEADAQVSGQIGAIGISTDENLASGRSSELSESGSCLVQREIAVTTDISQARVHAPELPPREKI